MANKTNCTVHGKPMYRLRVKVGKKLSSSGVWIDEWKNFYAPSKKEAERKAEEYMKNRKSVNSNECLGEYINQYIEEVFIHEHLADGTKARYVQAYRLHGEKAPVFGLKPHEVKAMDLQAFYNNSKAPFSGIKAINCLMKYFFRFAELNQICPDITRSVTIPKEKRNNRKISEVDVWKDEDLQKVINALSGPWNEEGKEKSRNTDCNRLRFLVILAVNTGARISELLALTYSDIKDGLLTINKQTSEFNVKEHGGVHISETKTINSNRVIPLSPIVLKELVKHKREHSLEMMKNGYRTDYIFTTSSGLLYWKSTVTVSLERLYKRIGVPYHKFHSFRHTFGTNLTRAGVPIEEASKLMGHKDINITMKYYIDVDNDRKQEAVNRIAKFSFA